MMGVMEKWTWPLNKYFSIFIEILDWIMVSKIKYAYIYTDMEQLFYVFIWVILSAILNGFRLVPLSS